jgi:hypothetical protein
MTIRTTEPSPLVYAKGAGLWVLQKQVADMYFSFIKEEIELC